MNYTPVIDLLKEAKSGPQRDFNINLSPSSTTHRYRPSKSSPLKNDTGIRVPKASPLSKPKQLYNSTVLNSEGNSGKDDRLVRELEEENDRLRKDNKHLKNQLQSQKQQAEKLTNWAEGVKEKLAKYHQLYLDAKEKNDELQKKLEERRQTENVVEEPAAEAAKTTKESFNEIPSDEILEKIKPAILKLLKDQMQTAEKQVPEQQTNENFKEETKPEVAFDAGQLKFFIQQTVQEVLTSSHQTPNQQYHETGNETAQMINDDVPTFDKVDSLIENEMISSTEKWEALKQLKKPLKKLDAFLEQKDLHKREQDDLAEYLMNLGQKLKVDSDLVSKKPISISTPLFEEKLSQQKQQRQKQQQKEDHLMNCRCRKCDGVAAAEAFKTEIQRLSSSPNKSLNDLDGF